MTADLVRHTRILEIVRDMIRVRAEGASLIDLAIADVEEGKRSIARIVELTRDVVTLQVFAGGRGPARFLEHPFDVTLRRLRFGAAKES